MTLTSHLLSRIAAEGPMNLAEFMRECLLNPQHGYYMTQDPFGTTGDFITAPEVSQMFGELLGLSLAQAWMNQGSPAPFTLAELGPGRGTLMADMLRATTRLPGFAAAAQVHLVEASPTLRARQAETLDGLATPVWADSVDALPRDQPLFLVANEFFDALPIRQFRRAGPFWRETVIGASEGALSFGLAPPAPLTDLARRLDDTAEGDIVEICAQAPGAAQAIGERIESQGGAALIVDYGDWRSLGDTFQAMHRHAAADPLDAPGRADLTAHVDFEPLAMASPSAHSLLTTQGVFLERLGITQRAQNLAAGKTGTAVEQLVRAHRRLTHPDEMGTLFKVLAFYPSWADPPPGMEPAGDRAGPARNMGQHQA